MAKNQLYTRLKEIYSNMEKADKRKIRQEFKKILEKTTISLDSISQDVFQTSIKVLEGKDDKWRNLSKLDKAKLLSFSFSDSKKSDDLFLKVVFHLFTTFLNSNTEKKGRGESWNIIYRGKKHKAEGIETFFRRFGNTRKKFDNNLFLKFDIASSTMLFSKYLNKFPEIQEDIINKIIEISENYSTEMFYTEGDALYFIFENAFKDYKQYCRQLTLFSIEVLQWMIYFNIYINPFDDDISLKIIGISNPIYDSNLNNQKEQAIKKLTLLEKNYIEPGNVYIDDFIADKLPACIMSNFSVKHVFIEGTQKYHYFTMKINAEKVEA